MRYIHQTILSTCRSSSRYVIETTHTVVTIQSISGQFYYTSGLSSGEPERLGPADCRLGLILIAIDYETYKCRLHSGPHPDSDLYTIYIRPSKRNRATCYTGLYVSSL